MYNLDSFEWVLTPKCRLPCISRTVNGEQIRYIPVRHAEIFLLAEYLSFIHYDIISTCTFVKGLHISKNEAVLLNIINFKHMNSAQCLFIFIEGKDYIASLDDVMQFYEFLEACVQYLQYNNEPQDIYKFGFISLISSTLTQNVPYILINSQKYLPIFYFENLSIELRTPGSLIIEGLYMAYIKFCCKIQGLTYNMKKWASCIGLRLDIIKNYIIQEYIFEEHFWPESISSKVNIYNKSKVVPNSWIKVENLNGETI